MQIRVAHLTTTLLLIAIVSCDRSSPTPPQVTILPRVPSIIKVPPSISLEPGKTEGTFRVPIPAKIAFAREKIFPVKLSVSTTSGHEVASREMPAERDSVEFELPPGTYHIGVSVLGHSASRYWKSFGERFAVTPKGRKSVILSQEIRIQEKMEELFPRDMGVVNVRRPSLTWKPVPGAAYYQVRWFDRVLPDGSNEIMPSGFFNRQGARVEAARFVFPGDLEPRRLYEWHVRAFFDDGTLVAHSNGRFQTGYLGYLLLGGRKIPLSAVILALLTLALVLSGLIMRVAWKHTRALPH